MTASRVFASFSSVSTSARSEEDPTRAVQRWWIGTCTVVRVLFATAPVVAQEQTLRSAVQIKVGETRQIAVFGGHRRDCQTGSTPDAIQVVQSPKLGALSQREGVPYVVEHSISNTCLGSRFLGTAVDYTAHIPGADTVALDGVFRNGRTHRIVSITVTQ